MDKDEYSKSSNEKLAKLIKEKLVEKRKCEKEIKRKSFELKKLKRQSWELLSSVREVKTILGARQGIKCPALKEGDKGHTHITHKIFCRAKRYKYHCWHRKEMYRKHCFACKLTPKEAKSAVMFNKILLGKGSNNE